MGRGTSAEGTHIAEQALQRREQLIVRLAEWVQSRGLSSPAILFLEAHKPLAPIGSQALFFLEPLLGIVGSLFGRFDDSRILAEYAALLEDPAAVDHILAHLEHHPVE